MGALTLRDAEFLAAFEAGQVAPADFHHREHVRLTWLYLGRDGLDRGRARMAAAIRGFATAAGHPELYHETLTQAWIELIWRARRADARADESFDSFIAQHPELLSKDLLQRHYRPETLESDGARRSFVEPDRAPFA